MWNAIVKFLFLSALIIVLQAGPVQAANAIGTIVDISGSAMVTHAGEKESHALKRKDAIALKDTIETTKGSRVKILFIDDTQFTLAEKTRLVIDEYVFDPENSAGNKESYSILAGAFQYVSGLVARKKDPVADINTSYGTIGIRGTRLMSAMKGSQRWIFLKDGNITVASKGGMVKLNPGEGTIMRNRETAPDKPHKWKPKEIAWIRAKTFGRDIEW